MKTVFLKRKSRKTSGALFQTDINEFSHLYFSKLATAKRILSMMGKSDPQNSQTTVMLINHILYKRRTWLITRVNSAHLKISNSQERELVADSKRPVIDGPLSNLTLYRTRGLNLPPVFRPNPEPDRIHRRQKHQRDDGANKRAAD